VHFRKVGTPATFLVHADEFRSVKQSLKDDLSFLKSSPYIREELKPRVRGFLYDIKSGSIEELKT
jgi:carbonic anhydrase